MFPNGFWSSTIIAWSKTGLLWKHVFELGDLNKNAASMSWKLYKAFEHLLAYSTILLAI